jgi:hypothetical protein
MLHVHQITSSRGCTLIVARDTFHLGDGVDSINHVVVAWATLPMQVCRFVQLMLKYLDLYLYFIN